MRVQLSILLGATLLVMLGGLATFQIISFIQTLTETSKAINDSLRQFISEQNDLTNKALKSNLEQMISVVESMKEDLKFLRMQQLTPLQELMHDVLSREADIVRLLEHLPMAIKPIDLTKLVPATHPEELRLSSVPPFKISLFPPGEDEISDSLRKGTPPGEVWSVAGDILGKNQHKWVIDVGGSVGYFGLMAAALGHRVFAFEPSPHLSEKYAQGVVLNHWEDRVSIFAVAVHGTSAGKASLTIGTHKGSSEQEKVLVQLAKIDDYVPNSEELFMIRISGRAFDMEVLQGAQRALQVAKFIFFEATRDELSHVDASSITSMLSFLDSMNFQIYRRWRDSNSQVTEFKEFASYAATSLQHLSVFCVKRGTASWTST